MKLLKAPNTYKPGTYGGWILSMSESKSNHILPSYYSGMVKPKGFIPTLHDKDGLLWMSVTVMELESQFHHNANAFGDVIVAGAGLCVLPFNLLQNPKVNHVTILERSPELFDSWGELVGLSQWKRSDKLTLINVDALQWEGKCDVLLADIWLEIGHESLEGDMETFVRSIKFKRMMCWGAEIAFIHWATQRGINAFTTKEHHAKEWSRQTGHYVWPGFHIDATNAATTALTGTTYPRA